MSYLFATLMVLVTLIAAVIFPFPPRPGKQGGWVAEVWMDWDICRGSTLYRQCFRTKQMAWLFAKLYALRLDLILPSTYAAEGWDGNPQWFKYEFAIHWGVRTRAPRESTANGFSPIWSPAMPGEKGFAGEHASAHPVFGAPSEDPTAELFI